MKIIGVRTIGFPEIKVIRYGRFVDERGYFTETYRKTDFQNNPELLFLKGKEFVQTNVSFSKKNVVRGLHAQWNPPIGKLVRVIVGRMIDFFLDIRKKSPNFGKIGCYEMSSDFHREDNEWIWVPSGFAHGGCFLEDTAIEYYCTGEYNPETEVAISPLADDINWLDCDPQLKNIFDKIISAIPIISEKDKSGHTLSSWLSTAHSDRFI